MLKKIGLICGLLVCFVLLTSSNNRKTKVVPYCINCYKCYNETYPYSHAHVRNIANRSFKDEHDNLKHKGYCVYKCQSGHILYVNYENGDKK